MHDPRLDRLAELLINHSVRLQPGEHVLIEAFDIPQEMTIALIRAARQVGGHPHTALRSTRVMRALNEDAGEDNLSVWATCDRFRMEQMQAYLGLRGADNVSEMAAVASDQMKAAARLYNDPVHGQQRVNHTKWCVLRWPSPSMAQLAQQSTDEFEDFYFDVCTLDYNRMRQAVQPLVERMERTDRVRLTGPGDTDLHFSIKDIPAIPCCGEMNIPDGECYTAPVRDSINGVLQYNAATVYTGVTFDNVRLEFRDGQVIDAGADQNTDQLNSILDTDEGARYVGEFAIGFNPCILEPMKDALFDEKIAGSIHLTPGRAYEDAFNGNVSSIHWDMVMIQRPEYGGGTMHFDDELVRQDGLFVVDDLAGLNPEALKTPSS